MSRNRLSTANFTGELQYGGVDMKTWAGRNPNPPTEFNNSPLPLLHCTMYQAVLDAYGESSPLLAGLLWEPPTPYPNDGNEYVWDEATANWEPVDPNADPSMP